MKLIGSNLERQIRQEMIAGRDAIFCEGKEPALFDALRENIPQIKNAFVLHGIPEQGEDIYDILVSEDCVLRVEISKNGSSCISKKIPVFDYVKKRKTRQHQVKLAVALDLLKQGRLIF